MNYSKDQENGKILEAKDLKLLINISNKKEKILL